MSQFKSSTMETFGTVSLYCEGCGSKIEGDPFQTSFSGICATFEPVHFCSKKCWESSEEYNTENWD